MRRMGWLSTVIVGAAIMGLALPASAQGRGYRGRMMMAQGGPGSGPGVGAGPGAGPGRGRGMGAGPEERAIIDPEMIESVAADIGVDQPTLAKIKGLVYGANREAIDVRASVARERLTLRELLDAEQPDRNRVLKQVDAIGALETKLRRNRVQLLLSVRELLTPEQRAKLQKVLAERRGPGRGPGRGFWGDQSGAN